MELTSKALVDNVQRVVEELAAEIARRSVLEMAERHNAEPGVAIQLGRVIERHAKVVLLDWFLAREERDSVEPSSESRGLQSGRDTGD